MRSLHTEASASAQTGPSRDPSLRAGVDDWNGVLAYEMVCTYIYIYMLISYCLFVNTYLNVYIGYTEWDIPIIYVRHTSVLSFVLETAVQTYRITSRFCAWSI